jgi:hypothetical protein
VLGRPPVRPAPDGGESSATSTARLPLLGRGKNLKTQKKPGKDSGTPGSKGSWTGRGGDHRPPHPEPCQTVEKPYLANKNKDFYSKTPTPHFLGTLAAPLPLAPLPLSPPAPSRALPRTAQPTAPLTRRRCHSAVWPRAPRGAGGGAGHGTGGRHTDGGPAARRGIARAGGAAVDGPPPHIFKPPDDVGEREEEGRRKETEVLGWWVGSGNVGWGGGKTAGAIRSNKGEL